MICQRNPPSRSGTGPLTGSSAATAKTGIDYARDEAKRNDLDGFVKALAQNEANASKDFDWFLAEALARQGPAWHPDRAAKPRARTRRPPAASPIDAAPVTLATVPGGEGQETWPESSLTWTVWMVMPGNGHRQDDARATREIRQGHLMAEPSRTVWDIHAGEALTLFRGGEQVRVEYVHKSGRLVRLVVSARVKWWFQKFRSLVPRMAA